MLKRLKQAQLKEERRGDVRCEEKQESDPTNRSPLQSVISQRGSDVGGMLTFQLKLCFYWCCRVKRHFPLDSIGPDSLLNPISVTAPYRWRKRTKGEMCVWDGECRWEEGVGRTASPRPITKKQALRQGPIITATRAGFHGDDAGMMLPAYWLFKR